MTAMIWMIWMTATIATMTALADVTAAAATTVAVAAPVDQVAVPPAHQPVVGAPAGVTGREAPSRLAFALPAAWVKEPPSSGMRLAQAKIPGPAGPAELAIFFFGAGGGGTADANIDRWIGQIDQPAAPPKRGSFATHGLGVTWVEVAGTMKPSTIGMGPATAQPGSRLLGAVVEGPGGPWFVKVIGPDATVAAARPAFLEMLHGLRTTVP
ncbi:MAG TPA: hypothetical protein VOA80_01880 [Thermoanaerobaculia bacterium]|nr:hypothetical protein [Thermoanaerobaculia bacterium]